MDTQTDTHTEQSDFFSLCLVRAKSKRIIFQTISERVEHDMKILAAITLLLLVIAVRAGDPGIAAVPSYPDTCNYTVSGTSMCGDQCYYGEDHCSCGSVNIRYWKKDDAYCCGESCTLNSYGGGRCIEGRTLSISSHCNITMRCYNSYQHSLYIGDQSHYTCPDTCVPWEAMCRGVSHCEGDHQVCGPHLRCPPRYRDSLNRIYDGWHNVTKFNISSSLVTGHHYCLGNTKIDNGKFDTVDRSDETQVRAEAQSPLDLNITSFTPCITNNSRHNPGVMCGKDCRWNDLWCRDDYTETCGTKSGNIATNDPNLCQHPRVWADVPCSWNYDDRRVLSYGLRCSGQNMRCVQPWYTTCNGEPWKEYITQCPDKSDQVFNSSLKCSEHLEQYSDFHTQKFCNENYSSHFVCLQSDLICTNKTQWLSTKDLSYTDPHSCQSSCSVPGPDCLACSNRSYFPCPKSGQCVHPDLQCDGHPQCEEGEDEDLSKCYEKYLKIQLIQPLAQFKCKSPFYKNMDIFATPRNNIPECWNNADEQESKDYSTILLVTSTVFITTFYIALKYSGLAKRILLAENQSIVSSVERDQNLFQDFLDYITLKNHGENHDQNEAIESTNVHILNSIHTQKVDYNRDTCELFYQLEQEIHEHNQSEIYLCLHRKLDPKVVENILDSGEPGCTAGCIEGFEKCIGRRLIMKLQNKITKSPILKEIIGTTLGIFKILAKFVDLTKDLALSLVMLQAVGGFQSVWDFQTNFSSIIIITMFSSILIPLFLSTLHLIVNRRKIIDEENFSRTRKYVTIVLCFIASFLNPIILDAYYHELKEDVRKLAQNHDIGAMTILRKCRNIKNQIVTFHKTELGQSNNK